ncbi:MAG: SDR family oxidoreductase [Acidimicrobiales bacterium]
MSRRVALVCNANSYVGPPLARLLAARGHDLVVGDPAEGLVGELEAAGATVEPVTGVGDLRQRSSADRLVGAALDRFGRLDSATWFTGRVFVGTVVGSDESVLHNNYEGNLLAPFHALQATLTPMCEQGSGQVLLITSSAGLKPTKGAGLYSATRAAANMLARNAAAEVASNGVQVNVVGTNFMDFPEFLRASGASDPAVRARIEASVPLGRLGGLDEFAHLCAVFVDGTARFQTGQVVGFDGGWSGV